MRKGKRKIRIETPRGVIYIRRLPTAEKFPQNWSGIRHLRPGWEKDSKMRRDLLIQNVSGA